MGSLLGDFVKGRLSGRYGQAVEPWIHLHRLVDSFTDSHPVVRRSKGRVSPVRRRFAGIMVDVFYDHFLAVNWHEYRAESLERFAARAYRILRERESTFPDALRRALPVMIRHNWLVGYRDPEVIRLTIDRIGTRIRRPNALAGGADELMRHYRALEGDFRDFLPDVEDYARRHAPGG